jgi:hypothetical protein
MRNVRYDPKIPTVPSGLPKITQKEMDEAIRAAARPNAVEEMLADAPGHQDYLLSDGSRLRIYRYTGMVVKL